MDKVLKVFLIITVVAVIFSGCTFQSDAIDSATYDGQKMIIGVIGEIPEVREEQIEFKAIDLETLKKNEYNFTYDGIMIMKDHLTEASKNEYASVYKKSLIPIFFIESEKNYLPFITEDLSYSQGSISEDLTYATGIFVLNEEMKYWSYGLYNDVQNEVNIKDVYSRMFRDIESSIYSDQIEIISSVKKYTPATSTVPGLPLIVQLNTAKLDDEKEYFWQGENGEFLTWQEKGEKIKLLDGSHFVKEETVYWTPGTSEWNDSVHLIVDVKSLENNQIIGRKKVEVKSDKDGWYSIQ